MWMKCQKRKKVETECTRIRQAAQRHPCCLLCWQRVPLRLSSLYLLSPSQASHL